MVIRESGSVATETNNDVLRIRLAHPVNSLFVMRVLQTPTQERSAE
jgi:hypothetical protein